MNLDFYKLGIIGEPLSHTISPVIQNVALSSCGLNGTYEIFEVNESDLEKQIIFFIKNNFIGFNVTIPHKINIMKYLNNIDTTAKKIGAVNTVLIDSNKNLTGYNTDISGFQNSIPQEFLKNIKNAKILGSGGAALAVAFGLDNIGCQNITIYNRNIKKAEDFISKISDKINAKLIADNFDNLKSLENTDILINATPLGTKGANENFSPINENIFKSANANLLVYDLVYNPQETLFLQMAKMYSKNTFNGLDMLILQGAKSFEIWTGKYPDTAKMKAAAIQNLNSN